MTYFVKQDFNICPRLCFVHIPKNAGNSVLSWMTDIYNEENICYYDHMPVSHPIVREIQDFKFTIVRNPFARAVSLYQQAYKILTEYTADSKFLASQLTIQKDDLDKGFDYYIQNLFEVEVELEQNKIIVSPSYTQLYYLMYKNKLYVDTVLRYENLKKEFKQIQRFVKSDIDLPFENISKNKEWKDYKILYTKSSKQKVEEYFKEDLEYFSYIF